MKKLFYQFSEYIFDKFFYNHFITVLEHELNLTIHAYNILDNSELIGTTEMKYLPPVGTIIEFYQSLSDITLFKIEKIHINKNGRFCKVYGSIII